MATAPMRAKSVRNRTFFNSANVLPLRPQYAPTAIAANFDHTKAAWANDVRYIYKIAATP
jgi:hypothetical protein